MNRSLFQAPSAWESRFIAEIFSIKHFRQLVSTKAILKVTPVADPFVIAAAKVKGGLVVTEETLKPNAARIPNICEHFRIGWLNLSDFIRDQGWSF